MIPLYVIYIMICLIFLELTAIEQPDIKPVSPAPSRSPGSTTSNHSHVTSAANHTLTTSNNAKRRWSTDSNDHQRSAVSSTKPKIKRMSIGYTEAEGMV